VFGAEQKNSTSLFLPRMSYKATKGLTASSPEIDCNQTAMDLPPVTSAVFLIAVILVKRGHLGGISETLHLRETSVSGMYVYK
jgi:hypothetical protein